MPDSTKGMRDCPKFEGCPAPICPLDPDWKLRVYRKGEPICFYLLEYVKPDAEAQFQGSIGVRIYKAIARSIEDMFHRYAPLRRALERAQRTGSRMATRKSASEQSRVREQRSDVVGSKTTRNEVSANDMARHI